MAYKWIKEENGEQALVINGWSSGVANSPETGIFNLQQTSLEIDGEVSSGWPLLTENISGGSLNVPTYGCIDFATKNGVGVGTYTYYMLDATGQAWGSTGSGTWIHLGNPTSGAGAQQQGIVVWHNYIFVFRNSSIDYAATNNPTSWTTGWNPATGGSSTQSITGGVYHMAFLNPENDIIYFCDGNTIGSLGFKSGSVNPFDPTDITTFTFKSKVTNAAALLLPFDEQSVVINCLGNNVMIGGITNRVYPWDVANSTYTAPLLLPETFTWKMVNANNFLFIFMGQNLSRGRIYVTSGSAITEFFKMPDALTNTIDPYWKWGDAIWHRNHLIFGVQAFNNSGDTVINDSSIASVWAIKLGVSILGDIAQRLSAINSLFQGTQFASVLLPVIGNSAKGGWDYFMGLTDTAGSPSYVIASSLSTSGNNTAANIYSDVIPVGTSIKPKSFEQLEFKLSRPMTTSETITLFTRSNLNDSYTQIGQTTTTVLSDVYPFNVQNLQWIQIQAHLFGPTDGSHVRITEIRLR